MVCVHCGGAIDVANSGLESPARLWRGRPRQYCSDACRMRAYRQRLAEDPDSAPPRRDPERERARAARDLAARLDAAVTAVRKSVPNDRMAGDRRTEALRRAAGDARRAAALATELAELLASGPGAVDDGAGNSVEPADTAPA